MRGIFKIKDLTEEQKNKYIRTKKEISKTLKNDYHNCKYAPNDTTEKIIKNCRGVRKCNGDVNRIEKRNQRDNFRILLAFKENDIYQSKEYSISLKIKKVFPNEIIDDQYKVNILLILLFLFIN